jgi:hypothetical protein
MRNQTRTIFAIIAIVAAIGLAVSAATSNPAYAQISCTNGGGNQPPGQQPICKGKGLTQQLG